MWQQICMSEVILLGCLLVFYQITISWMMSLILDFIHAHLMLPTSWLSIYSHRLTLVEYWPKYRNVQQHSRHHHHIHCLGNSIYGIRFFMFSKKIRFHPSSTGYFCCVNLPLNPGSCTLPTSFTYKYSLYYGRSATSFILVLFRIYSLVRLSTSLTLRIAFFHILLIVFDNCFSRE